MSVNTQKSIKKVLIGTVTSDKMDKTIVVRVESKSPHYKYPKLVRRAVKFKAHDEKNSAKTGNRVRIIQSRPLSRDKRWRLLDIIEKAE